MAKLYKSNGEVETISPKETDKFQLEELQNYVGGDIELFTINKKTFIVNENGLVENLPINWIASDFLQLQSDFKTQILVGNVIVLNSINEID